jgi:hypothetical protein
VIEREVKSLDIETSFRISLVMEVVRVLNRLLLDRYQDQGLFLYIFYC